VRLVGQHIRERGIFTPFHERTREFGMTFGLGPAGYDVRIAQDLQLPPGGFALASTVEHFDVPDYLTAEVKDKSTWARRGLSLFNTIIEPGWRGFLTLELKNQGADRFRRADRSGRASL
jgi:dCTP deaminase